MDDDSRWDLINEIEHGTGGSAAKIAAFDKLIERETVGTLGWTNLVLVAADYRSTSGDLAGAIAAIEDALERGVPTNPSAEAHLLEAFLRAGESDRAAEVDRTLSARSAEKNLYSDYAMVGEAYEEAGRLDDALRWFSMANQNVEAGDHGSLNRIALWGRQRVRRELGMPEDEYDVSAEHTRKETLEGLHDANG